MKYPLSVPLFVIPTVVATPVMAQRPSSDTTVRGTEEWVLPTANWLHGGAPRFAGRFRVVGTQATIYLDSAVAFPARQSPMWVTIDSTRAHVAQGELMLNDCGPSPDSLTGFHIAVVRDSADTHFNYPPPRLSWILDTTEARIRPLEPSRVRCIKAYAGQ